jgi:co-chaperonin GroES (HSP10)
MKAINHYVVVDRIKETENKTTGFIMKDDDNSDVRYFKGKVISAGNLVECINSDDIVWYDRFAGHGIEYDGKFYFVLKASDIVLVD